MVISEGKRARSGGPASDRSQGAKPPVRHLSQAELAERLGVSVRTIEGWRSRGKGPRYLKMEGRIAYRVGDVERFETLCARDGRRLSRGGRGKAPKEGH
jgi:uncharacterized protein YjcR